MYKLSHTEIYAFANGIITDLKVMFPTRTEITCFPVPRGGIPAAYALGEVGRSLGVLINLTDTPEDADFILDDLIDSGATRDKYADVWPDTPFFALVNKPYYRAKSPLHELCDWLVFPWEHDPDKVTDSSADDIPVRLLQYIGEDVQRGGLLETPKRFLKAWKEKTVGYQQKPEDVLKVFEDGAENYDEMIVVRDIEIESVCEHHLERVWGVAHIGYIPDGKIIGLSKFSRIADVFARRLQVQERLTVQICDAIEEHLKPLGVGVVIEARHACMEVRGIKRRGQTTVTSALRGVFKEDGNARAEFLKLTSTDKLL